MTLKAVSGVANLSNPAGTLPVANGGTGAITAGGATANLILSYTWATKPDATTSSGHVIRITDVGANSAGSLWVSDGTRWYPGSGQVLLAQGAVPIGIAPSGTMGANGAVTLGTALGGTYSAANCGGIWLYFPAGAVASGSAAGFYWCVMTNTTAGTVFNTTYTPASGTYPTIPASPTPVVDAGPGAFTGVTSSITAITYTLPGGVLSINGSMQDKLVAHYNNSAGAKTFNAVYGSSTFGASSVTTSTGSTLTAEVRNSGTTAKQIGSNFSAAAVGSFLGIDSTTAQANAITLSHAVATDWIVLEMWELWVRP